MEIEIDVLLYKDVRIDKSQKLATQETPKRSLFYTRERERESLHEFTVLFTNPHVSQRPVALPLFALADSY